MALDNPILERLYAGDVPAPGRLSVARGLLPLSREEYLEALAYLRGDSDQEVQSAALDALFEFKPDELAKMGRSEDFRPETFALIVRSLRSREELLEQVILNQKFPADLTRQVAAEGGERLGEAIVINQQRLLSAPSIIEALLRNPRTGRNTIRQLYEIREQFLKDRKDWDELFRQRMGVETLIAQSGAAAPAPAPAAPAPAPTPAPAATAAAPGAPAKAPEDGEEAEEPEEAEALAKKDEHFATAYAKVLSLNVPEKCQLALLGNREERAILIRDSTKLVSEAVLESPKLTPDEVRSFIKLRSLPEGLVRKIAANKDWMSDDVVLLGVVKHPKSPNALVSSLLVRLNDKILKKLAKDKEVSEVVRRTVKRFNEAKELARLKSAKVGKH